MDGKEKVVERLTNALDATLSWKVIALIDWSRDRESAEWRLFTARARRESRAHRSLLYNGGRQSVNG